MTVVVPHLTQRRAPAMAVPRSGIERAAVFASVAAGVLMAIAAIAGLVVADLYQDPPGLRHMLRGHDLVTLVVAVPLLFGGLAMRSGTRARLVWLGAFAFATYNYSVYVFGSAFNDLFLVHVAILELAAVSLVLGLTATRVTARAGRRQGDGRLAASFLAFLAVGLAGMWLFYSLRFAVSGETPAESALALPIASTHLGYALDLTLIVPTYLAAAVLLWRRSTWGEVLAPVLAVGGLLQQLTYMSALVFQYRADVPGATAFDPGEPIVVAAYVLVLALLLHRARLEPSDLP
jgi:hypothetical protein